MVSKNRWIVAIASGLVDLDPGRRADVEQVSTGSVDQRGQTIVEVCSTSEGGMVGLIERRSGHRDLSKVVKESLPKPVSKAENPLIGLCAFKQKLVGDRFEIVGYRFNTDDLINLPKSGQPFLERVLPV